MKRSAEHMSYTKQEYRPFKRHKTTNDIYELMISLERRISTIENMCKIIFDDVRSNVILTAILTYMASEDESKASREKRVMPVSPRTGKQAVWPKKRAPRRNAPNN